MTNAVDRPLGRTAARLASTAALLLLAATGSTAAGENAGWHLAQASPPGAARTAPRQTAPAPAPAEAASGPQDVQRQITELHKRLNITATQETPFNAFAQALQQNAQEMNTLLQQEQQKPNRTAVDDLRASAQLAQVEADGLKKLIQPLQTLYDSLSDQQKRTADQVLGSASPANQPPPRSR